MEYTGVKTSYITVTLQWNQTACQVTVHISQHYEPMFDLHKTLACGVQINLVDISAKSPRTCSPTAAPCTTQLPMSRQVCAPQFYQRMTARSIFDRCGDRHECSNFSHPATPSGRPDTKTTNYQRMTARWIFDRCGNRRMLTFQPALGTHQDAQTRKRKSPLT